MTQIHTQLHFPEALSSIAAGQSDTTDYSSLENSAILAQHHKSHNLGSNQKTSGSGTLDNTVCPGNADNKEFVEPIFENKEEEDFVSDGHSNSLRDVPTFGKASFRSSKSGSKLQRSSSNNKERDRSMGQAKADHHLASLNAALPRVSPLSPAPSLPCLVVNIVGLDMQECSIVLHEGEDPSLQLMKYCCERGINDMALVMVMKKMVSRELERRSLRNKPASIALSTNCLPPFSKMPPLPVPRTKSPSANVTPFQSIPPQNKHAEGPGSPLTSEAKKHPNSAAFVKPAKTSTLPSTKACARQSSDQRKSNNSSQDGFNIYKGQVFCESGKQQGYHNMAEKKSPPTALRSLTPNRDEPRTNLSTEPVPKPRVSAKLFDSKRISYDFSLRSNGGGKKALLDTSKENSTSQIIQEKTEKSFNGKPAPTKNQAITNSLISKLNLAGSKKPHMTTTKTNIHSSSFLGVKKDSIAGIETSDKLATPGSKTTSFMNIIANMGANPKKSTAPSGAQTTRERNMVEQPLSSRNTKKPAAALNYATTLPSNPTGLQRSSNEQDNIALKFLFDKLDGDKDGLLSTDRISIFALPKDMISDIDALLRRIIQSARPMDFPTFSDHAKRLNMVGYALRYFVQANFKHPEM